MQDLTNRLKHNRAVFRTLQEKLNNIPDSDLQIKWKRIIALLGSGVHPNPSDVIACKKLFTKAPYSLEDLSYAHMVRNIYFCQLNIVKPSRNNSNNS